MAGERIVWADELTVGFEALLRVGGEAGEGLVWVALGFAAAEGFNVWIKRRGNTAVKLKQGRRGRGGGRAGDYVGGGRGERLGSPSQFHQEVGRVASAALWVLISSGVDFAIFIAVTLQNVGGSGLLGVRDSGSASDGEDIYGSSGGKGCIISREDVGGGAGSGGRGSKGSSLRFTSRGSLIAFSHTSLER